MKEKLKSCRRFLKAGPPPVCRSGGLLMSAVDGGSGILSTDAGGFPFWWWVLFPLGAAPC